MGGVKKLGVLSTVVLVGVCAVVALAALLHRKNEPPESTAIVLNEVSYHPVGD